MSKGKAKGAKKSAAKPASRKTKVEQVEKPREKSHLPVAQMVNEALETLDEKKGSSLKAIKKYISRVYGVEITDKFSSRIKKYLKTSINKSSIIQTKGTGASGSFKLSKDYVKQLSSFKKEKAKKIEKAEVASKNDSKEKKAVKKSKKNSSK